MRLLSTPKAKYELNYFPELEILNFWVHKAAKCGLFALKDKASVAPFHGNTSQL